jgi:hypothetical protein
VVLDVRRKRQATPRLDRLRWCLIPRPLPSLLWWLIGRRADRVRHAGGIAWAERRQRIAEKKSERRWTAKSEAVHEAAVFATRLDRLLQVDVETASPYLLVRLKEVCDELEHATAAGIATYASPEVLLRFNGVLISIIMLQPDQRALGELYRAAQEKEDGLQAHNFEEAALARGREVEVLESSGLAEAFTESTVQRLRTTIDRLVNAIRDDVQS